MMAKVFEWRPSPWTLAALWGGGRRRGGRPPSWHWLRALWVVFVVRLELHLHEVPVLLADDLADESREGLQVSQQSLQLRLQQGNPLLHVLASLVQVRHHVVHDVLSLQQDRGNTLHALIFQTGVRFRLVTCNYWMCGWQVKKLISNLETDRKGYKRDWD